MSTFSNELIEEIKVNISTILCEGLGINNKDYQKNKENNTSTTYHPFQLPIQYLPEEKLHSLSTIVTNDLELVEAKGETSIYEKLFQPTNVYGLNMIQEWKKNFTFTL